ncbi:unnamed protein product [Cylindrotheca closterium]|uniref:Uncharacterized protein n=1 Tax=Cylindrotheca closterium TaxID=2856 RepID=A0AAD2GAL5_9STRA|nr:unnamed protein product [Cylindrotheca closterium]
MGKLDQVGTIDENLTLDDKARLQKEEERMSPTEDTTDSTEKTEKKGVHWYHKVQKKRHIRIQDMEQEERNSTWYTEADSKLILAMAKVTVKMIMKDEPCDDVDYCSRGLEGKTPAGSKRRQKNKMKVRRAVLEEQDIQRDEGVINMDFLGEVSRMCSKDVGQQAHERGLADEDAVREYLHDVSFDASPIQPRR